jgi:hypothetical protein
VSGEGRSGRIILIINRIRVFLLLPSRVNKIMTGYLDII